MTFFVGTDTANLITANAAAGESRVRYAILITDAPPHGKRFAVDESIHDDKPEAGDEAPAVLSLLANQRIQLFVCHVAPNATAKFRKELFRLVCDSITKSNESLPVPDEAKMNIGMQFILFFIVMLAVDISSISQTCSTPRSHNLQLEIST
jgi:hypothetical protein